MKCPTLFALFAMALALLMPTALARTLRLGREVAATAHQGGSCVAEDLAVRTALQNKLADVCVEMCKELGAYPEKCACPDYVDTTDKTPGVVTWPELLKYMGDVDLWGQDTLKHWRSSISALQMRAAAGVSRHSQAQAQLEVSGACLAHDLQRRAAVQNTLADVCVEMCKEVGAYPEKCACPDYTDTTDKTPGTVTWPELLTYMDEVEAQGAEALKTWRKRAGQ
eukprot:CAMPEP_0180498812 /NCGR_PEP_ID=MMETSP1036_2-20121128/43538_1 /TAXON_ID=632150 /ORGANISM="Azadinium spinosum, Strain 3D9" /LENGTH=223 /DNA_ID=CAMNT_0022507477 /DNA_START=46 /DNA_END=717 /DNA_ORIENTATION=+